VNPTLVGMHWSVNFGGSFVWFKGDQTLMGEGWVWLVVVIMFKPHPGSALPSARGDSSQHNPRKENWWWIGGLAIPTLLSGISSRGYIRKEWKSPTTHQSTNFLSRAVPVGV